jgi:hypothetical protein
MNLKYNLLLISFTFLSSRAVLGQQRVQVLPEKNSGLIGTLPNVTAFKSKLTKSVRASFFVVDQGSGSAKLSESDESVSRILVVVSEYGEHPESSLFSVGPFFNPVVVTGSNTEENAVMITHGPVNHRKTNKVIFNAERVIYQ